MNYSKQYIAEFGARTGFISSNIEKVIRLLDVLRFIGSELDPEHKMLVLKGGTAINLLYMDLPRLSVDIDLDYVGSLDKEETTKDREIIMNSLDGFMSREGYVVSTKSRGSAILASRHTRSSMRLETRTISKWKSILLIESISSALMR